MDISWRAFFVLWAVTIFAHCLWDIRSGISMLALAGIAIVLRLVGYEKGWRIVTVMPFLGSLFLLGAVIFRP